MIYAVVFIGSLSVLCLLGLMRVLLKQRSVRRFVRSVRQRFEMVEARGGQLVEETVCERPRRSPRTSAIELQQVRSLVRNAEKALKQEKIDETERFLIQALTIHPHDCEARSQLAKLYLTSDRESKAEAMYKELLLRHDDVSFHANLGLAYYRQGKYMEACHAYQEALNRDPKNPERCAALGRACIAAQRFSDAVPLLEKATAFLTRDIPLLHLLAESYLQVGDKAQAQDAYMRINRLEPYDESVKKKLQEIRKTEETVAA